MSEALNPSDKTSSSAWGGFYKTLENPVNFFPENFIARIFLSKNPVQCLEHDFKGKRLLDIGCGHGRHIPFFESLGLQVDGLEVTDEQVKALQQTFPTLNFYKGKSASIPVADAQYDYLAAVNAIYYVDDLESGFEANIKECTRLLKSGGYFIFSMVGAEHSLIQNAHIENKYAQIQQDFLGFRNDTWLRPLWDKDELADLLPGLELQKTGEVKETLDGFVRHIYYCVAKKL